MAVPRLFLGRPAPPMNDGTPDRADAVSPVPDLRSREGVARRPVAVPLWVDERDRLEALGDRRMIKGVLIVGASLIFLGVIAGWL